MLLKKIKLKTKFALAYILIAVVLVASIGIYSYTRYAQILHTQARESFEQSTVQMEKNIEYKLSIVSYVADQVRNNSVVSEILSQKEPPQNEAHQRLENNEKLKQALGGASTVSESVSGIFIYTDNPNVPTDGHYIFSKEIFLKDSEFSWVEEFLQTSYSVWTNGRNAINGKNEIMYITKLTTSKNQWPSSGEELGILMVTIPQSEITQVLEQIEINGAKSELVGNHLYISNSKAHTQNTHSEDFLEQKSIGKTGLSLKTYVPFDYVRQNVFDISKEVLAISFAIILLSTIVIVLTADLLTRRIYLFKRKMELIRDNRTELLYNLGGSDEITELDVGLNEMVDRLHSLLSDLYKVEAQKKDAELKYLQTQINPHFLYNTLDSIKSCVDLGQNDNAVKMLIALKNYFRTGLNRGNDVISVQDEIKHASAYIDIQKFRSDNLFEVEWDVDEDLKKRHIMKTILQPIIENSIQHGIYERGDNGKIKVRIRQCGKYLYICVFDNGIGVSKSQLEDIRATLKQQGENKSVGMKNVKNRLENYYSNGCSFEIYSVQDKGFYTVMRIEMSRIDN